MKDNTKAHIIGFILPVLLIFVGANTGEKYYTVANVVFVLAGIIFLVNIIL